MNDDTRNPGPLELIGFVAMWAVLFVGVAWLGGVRPEALRGAAAFTGVCALFSLVLDTETRLRRRAWGLAIPAVLAAVWGVVEACGAAGVNPSATRAGLYWVLGAVGAVGFFGGLASERGAVAMYRGWMAAARPIGWTISFVLLGAVFLVVVTPMGLVMRAAGRDPMERRFEPDRKSYWVERETGRSSRRYFRQY